MKYKNVTRGFFIDRPNRFIAHVEIEGKIETVHVKNTGRCRELLLPGTPVILDISDNPARKTKYDLVVVEKKGIGLVNIDSQAPNKVVKEWLEKAPELFPEITCLKPEYKYGNSRIDFYFEHQGRKVLMEVKGVTLEKDGICYFPDAPTERGVKHVKELTGALEEGYECYVAFVLQMAQITEVYPYDEMHPEFGQALRAAEKAGVSILALGCEVGENSMLIDRVSKNSIL